MLQKILSLDGLEDSTTKINPHVDTEQLKTSSEKLCAADIQPIWLPCVYEGCRVEFQGRKRLSEHVEGHIQRDGDTRCHNCGRRDLKTIHIMIDHIWACNGIKPYVCPFRSCAYGSAQKGGLKKHIETYHQFSIRLVYICPIYQLI